MRSAVGSDIDLDEQSDKIRDYFERKRNKESARNMADAAEKEAARQTADAARGAVLDKAIRR